jgi:hypothetical protein
LAAANNRFAALVLRGFRLPVIFLHAFKERQTHQLLKEYYYEHTN